MHLSVAIEQRILTNKVAKDYAMELKEQMED